MGKGERARCVVGKAYTALLLEVGQLCLHFSCVLAEAKSLRRVSEETRAALCRFGERDGTARTLRELRTWSGAIVFFLSFVQISMASLETS